MLSSVTIYSNKDRFHGLRLTPQYSFNWGMKELKQAEYDATVSKLSNNLISMNPVDMLNKTPITSYVCVNKLSYLKFLKRKRIGTVKAIGYVNSRL